ncbi:MAG: hypothetical protein DDT32_01694 [Syntrophomonadaceae bacterium]|nr:hypothetical protein [Bacillota bacterium]
MNSVRSGKKDKRKKINKPAEDWEKELNIKYHDVNPQWNYTISPRSDLKQVKRQKERMKSKLYFAISPKRDEASLF